MVIGGASRAKARGKTAHIDPKYRPKSLEIDAIGNVTLKARR
jgi:hypothetical protein